MDSCCFRLIGLLFMIQTGIHINGFEIEHIYANEIKHAQLSYVAIVDDKDGDQNNAAEELNAADSDNVLNGIDKNNILGEINNDNSLKHGDEKTVNHKPYAPSRKIIGTKVNPFVNEESETNEFLDGQEPGRETGKVNTLGTHNKHEVLWDDADDEAKEHKTGGVVENKPKSYVQIAQSKGVLETKPKKVTREHRPTDINNVMQKEQDKQNSMGEYRNENPHQDVDKLRKYLSFNNGLSQDDIGDVEENKTDIFGHARGLADNSGSPNAHNKNGMETVNTLGSDRQPSGDCGPNKVVHLDGGLSQNGLHNLAKSNKAEIKVNQENASEPLTIFESNKNLGVQKDMGNKLTNVETYVFFPQLQRRAAAEADCTTTTTPSTTTCETTTTPCPTTTTPCPTTTTPCPTTTTPCPTTTTPCPTTTTPCPTTTTLCPTTTTPCPTTTTPCPTTTTPCPTTTTPCPTTTTRPTTCETTTTPCPTTQPTTVC